MNRRPCIVCGRITTSTRCPTHAAQRPTYDHAHRRRRATLLPAAIGAACPLCRQPMTSDQPLDLDHTTNAIVHATCNRKAGAATTNGQRTPTTTGGTPRLENATTRHTTPPAVSGFVRLAENEGL